MKRFQTIPSSALSPAFDAVSKMCSDVVVVLADGFDVYESTRKCHEAGYDAYMTGSLLVKMSGMMGIAPKVNRTNFI